jgi:general secretion pathway protein D
MKTISTLVLGLVVWAAAGVEAADTVPAKSPANQPALTNAVAAPPGVVPAIPDPNQPADGGVNNPPAEATPAVVTGENGTNGLRLNFRGAPLDAVLEYLSDAAGFIIVKEARVRGTVDVWSNQPMTKDEAVNLLNSVLKKNGYAAIRNGRTLTIINRDEAKTHDIPVISGSDPEKIPRNDEIVTQIIPVRFVEVKQLVTDLQPLVSSQSTLTANEAGNAIVMTDTQANIRRVAEIIVAIDSGAEDFTEVRVFRLMNSDPVETADLLSSLFPDDSRNSNSNSQSPFSSGFGRFFGRSSRGDSGSSNNNSQNQRLKKRNRVIAVADQRTASIIVSASRDLMEQIEGVVTELDSNRKGRQTVHVYELRNASPQEALPVLQDMFGKNGTQNNRNTTTQNDPLLNRSTTQNQQNNTGVRTGSGNNGTSRGVGGRNIARSRRGRFFALTHQIEQLTWKNYDK